MGPRKSGDSTRVIRLLRESVDESGALDIAVSRVLLERAAEEAIVETFRLYRPRRILAFGRQDANEPGFSEAVKAIVRRGFDPVIRLAGGRAAVFHEGTLAFALAISDADPLARARERFVEMADVMRSALARLEIDARVGQVSGEYCPGDYSVNARGKKKIVGIGQRVIARAAHVGGVVSAEGGTLLRDILGYVYPALGLSWNQGTVGSVAEETGATWTEVEAAIIAELESRYEIIQGTLEQELLATAAPLAPDYAARDETEPTPPRPRGSYLLESLRRTHERVRLAGISLLPPMRSG